MLRVIPTVSADAAKRYHDEGLSREDYYSQGQELAGEWGGKAAERLGLTGMVGREDFHALCDNLRPDTGESLTARTNAERRVGYDFNFNAPKSLSVLHAVTGDERLLDAFRVSVRETMREVEGDMKTRVRVGGADGDRVTGNMVWAEFVHLTARPVGGAPDPHLHAHCFAFNATFDGPEQRWKAGQFGDVKRDASYYEAVFHAHLADRVEGLGYGCRREGRFWEVEAVPQGVRDKFSGRAAEVERIAREEGITNARDKDQLAARSRAGKRKGEGMDELRLGWAARLTPDEHRAIAEAATAGPRPDRGMSASMAMDYALEHSFERASAVPDKRLLGEALRFGVGSVSVGEMKAELNRPGILGREVDGQRLVTTRAVLDEERAMIAFARDGRGVCAPLKGGPHDFQQSGLNAGQRAAVAHVLASPDRVMAIEGGAGVGKTTLMKEAVAAIEANGSRVFTFAPSADASRGVLRAEGFANADTVEKLLHSVELRNQVRGGVLWVDEAGLLGARTMHRLFDLAGREGCRVILSGDTAQHGAVERGDALRVLQSHAGIVPARVRDIVRQKGEYRSAVADLGEGRLEQAFARLEAMGAVQEVPNGALPAVLARDYALTMKAGGTALVVSPTHAEGERVTDAIRAVLREGGALTGADREIPQLRNLHLTAAQRADPHAYRPGHVVQFGQRAAGIERGARLTVERIDGRTVHLRAADGAARAVPLHQADRFQVYEARSVNVAAGDVVRVTQNGMTAEGHRLDNGSLYRVAGFTKGGNLRLADLRTGKENGKVVAKGFGHLGHGYVTTSHASQGKTVDRVFVAQSADSFPASSREQIYVSASRGRHAVTIYTDDREGLRRAVARSGARVSASEVAGDVRYAARPNLPERTAAKAGPASRHRGRVYAAVRQRAADYARAAVRGMARLGALGQDRGVRTPAATPRPSRASRERNL